MVWLSFRPSETIDQNTGPDGAVDVAAGAGRGSADAHGDANAWSSAWSNYWASARANGHGRLRAPSVNAAQYRARPPVAFAVLQMCHLQLRAASCADDLIAHSGQLRSDRRIELDPGADFAGFSAREILPTSNLSSPAARLSSPPARAVPAAARLYREDYSCASLLVENSSRG